MMFTAEQYLDRSFRFLKKAWRRGASSTETVNTEARIPAYPYVPLPGATEFRAVLADEYDKAAQSQKNLTVLYLDLPDCPPERVEKIDVLLRGIIRTRETVFLYSPTCFALILRKMGAKEAALF